MVRTYTRKYTNSRNGKSYLPYQNYSPENLQEAIYKVKEGKMSLTDASNTYGVPKSTLSRKTRNINCTQEKAGHPTLFSPEEERIFLKFILLVGEWGFPFNSTDLRVFAQRYLNKIGKQVYSLKDNMPGFDWACNFLQRHHLEISNRKSAHISSDRARFTSEELDVFFENYAKTIEGVGADCIINYDETNLTDDPGNKKFIYRRGCKYPERIINSSKTAVSLMFSGTASGHLLPIYVVYKSENLWDTWMEAGPEGTRYNRSKSGWFDSTCFEDWFHSIIVPYVRNKSGQKVVLIGDNLSSHFSEKVLITCEKINISFICLPPKTTHLLQPLDVAFFAPLKSYWRDILTKWKLAEGRNHKTLVKSAFPKLLCKLKNKLVENDAESNNLIAGFNKSGLYPVDPNRPKSRLPQSHDEEEIETCSTSVIKDILMEIRCPQVPEGIRRKKKFVVEPGKSVTAEDLVTCQPQSNLRSKKSGKREKLLKSTLKIVPDLFTDPISEDLVTCQPQSYARSKKSGKREISSKSTSKIVPDPFIDPIPGPSGLCKINNKQSYDSDISDEQIAPIAMPMLGPIKSYTGKGKGVGKKTNPCEKQSENSQKTPLDDTLLEKICANTTISKFLKKKRVRKSKDSSTSISDCDMSTHSDSDIGDCGSDATIEADDLYSVSESISKTDKTYSTGDKTDLGNATDEIDLNQNTRNLVISELKNITENYDHTHELLTQQHQDPLYSVRDFVLVRYHVRKTWTYYVGVIQEINKDITCGKHLYTIFFFKTVKKPLAFRKTRLIDRDIVDDLSIIKQISLKESNNPNELLLAEEGDEIYFN